MPRFEHIFFVCTNARPAGHSQGSCAERGGEALLLALKDAVAKEGLKGRVRVVRSGCLDLCRRGCALVAYSAGRPAAETWYSRLEPQHAEALFAAHVQRGERLAEHAELGMESRCQSATKPL